MTHRADIAEVARHARVSKSTVSRVINGGYASAEVKARVAKVIAKLGYTPWTTARNFSLGRAGCVGLVMEDTQSEWITQILGGIEEELTTKHISLLVGSLVLRDKYDSTTISSWIRERRVDGLIFARAGRREMQEELSALELPKPDASSAPPAAPVYEVDDEWFKEDDKARAAKVEERRRLAQEMGIHDVELPEAEPVAGAPAPAKDLDFDFGLEDLNRLAGQGPLVIKTASVSSSVPPAPEAPPGPVALSAPEAPKAPFVLPVPSVFPEPTGLTLHTLEAEVLAPFVAMDDRDVADDFAALLAFEQGEVDHAPRRPAPVAAAPPAPVIHTVTPEITDDMLDQIATRVAERLNAGLFGSRLREAMTETVRETVRSVVAETSERLVREEIERVRSRNRT